MPIVDLPKCSLWQMGGLLGGAATTWTLPALRRPRLPGPDRQPACRGATVWSARRLHIEPTMLAYLNGMAAPTAVLGEDLSGSIPVGSALNTHGPASCYCARPVYKEDTPDPGRARRRKFQKQHYY